MIESYLEFLLQAEFVSPTFDIVLTTDFFQWNVRRWPVERASLYVTRENTRGGDGHPGQWVVCSKHTEAAVRWGAFVDDCIRSGLVILRKQRQSERWEDGRDLR